MNRIIPAAEGACADYVRVFGGSDQLTPGPVLLLKSSGIVIELLQQHIHQTGNWEQTKKHHNLIRYYHIRPPEFRLHLLSPRSIPLFSWHTAGIKDHLASMSFSTQDMIQARPERAWFCPCLPSLLLDSPFKAWGKQSTNALAA